MFTFCYFKKEVFTPNLMLLQIHKHYPLPKGSEDAIQKQYLHHKYDWYNTANYGDHFNHVFVTQLCCKFFVNWYCNFLYIQIQPQFSWIHIYVNRYQSLIHEFITDGVWILYGAVLSVVLEWPLCFLIKFNQESKSINLLHILMHLR